VTAPRHRRFSGLALPALLVAWSILASPLVSSELRCAVCGEIITGRYLEESGRAYHESCYARVKAPRCAVCGQPIVDSRIDWEGKSYHETCYREAKQPHCAACGKPIEGTYLVQGGKSYHPACLRTQATRCVICGEPLGGSFLVDPWGNPFHERHGRKVLCPFCSRAMAPSTTGGSVVSSANGMRVCAICDRSGVDRPGRAATLVERIRLQIFDSFPVREGSFTWELVDKARLNALLPPGQRAGGELGLTLETKTRSGRRVSVGNRVYLLSGLPSWLLEAVIAHELIHVWQHLEGLDSLPLDQAEGSAELASYLVLKHGGSDEAKVKMLEMEKSPDPDYGVGFRKALEVSMKGQAIPRLQRVLRGARGWPGRP